MLTPSKIKQELLKQLTNERAQSIVELSLIAPLLMIALYIPADFGIAMFTSHLTQNAVREAARIGVSTEDPFDSAAATAVQTEALNRLPARLASQTVAVKYYASGAANCLQFVEVTAQGNYNVWFYQLLRLFGGTVTNPIQITRTTRMRYQFQPMNNTGLCTGVSVQTS